MGNDAKKTILARRAGFLAAAMAGLAADGCGKTEARDAGVEMTPAPCLSVATVVSAEPPPSPPRESADGGGAVKKGCDPPYTIDANGQKHYKADCL